jgi:mono/diheme cytochrome c family protein
MNKVFLLINILVTNTSGMGPGKILLFAELVFIIMIFTRIWSCTHDPLLDNIPEICFERDVLPVLISRCASTGCHDAVSHKEGYVFTSYSTTMITVTPGNPVTSKLYKVIKLETGEDRMPPAGKPLLTIAEIDSIAAWISNGALNQNCGEICDTLNPITFSGTIWPIMQSSCTGCHSGASPGGGVLLANYNNVATIAASRTLINSLKGNGVTKMPPGISFSACRIRQFEIWVKNGYLNN